MIAFAGLAFAAALVDAHLPLPIAIAATIVFAALIGANETWTDRHPDAAALVHRDLGVPVHISWPDAGRA